MCKPGLDYTDPRTCASCPDNTFYNSETGECNECGCNPTGTARCSSSGECICKENFTGISCDECEVGCFQVFIWVLNPSQNDPSTFKPSFKFGTPDVAVYHTDNVRSLSDYKVSQLPTQQNIIFQENHYGFQSGFCRPCDCNPYGTEDGNLQCDFNGYCQCKEGHDLINARKCDGCPEGQALVPNSPDQCEGRY